MPQKYNQKMVVAGDIVDLYTFSMFRVQHCATFKKGLKISENKIKEKSTRSHYTDFRAKRRIINLVNANKQKLTKFITLTFRENIQDLNIAHYEFQKFVARLKTLDCNFKYLAVVEFQQRGAIHYHLICNIHYVKNQILEQIWRNGYTEIRNVRHVRNLGLYFASHGIKNQTGFIEKSKLGGRKKFFCSRKLKKPKEYIGTEAIRAFLKNYVSVSLFSNIYFDYYGQPVQFEQFRLEEKHN